VSVDVERLPAWPEMAVQHLGDLSGGPVLFFGGPYSNLQATEALLEQARALGLGPDRVICTGDVVAYCADASATTAAVRDFGCPVVRGNCEESFGAGGIDCGCGFEEGSACDLLSQRWFAHAVADLSAEDCAWMARTAPEIRFTFHGRTVSVIHGGFSASNRFVFETEQAALAEELALTDADIVVAGHSGKSFTAGIGGRLWHNAGVIGMPANDGDVRTEYSVLDFDRETGSPAFSHHRLVYNHEGAARAMADAGLPDGYREGLLSGYWPNQDILPEVERVG